MEKRRFFLFPEEKKKRRVRHKKKSHKPRKSLLPKATKDLRGEMRRLAREKAKCNNAIKNLNSTMGVDRMKEKKLEHKMTELIKRKAELNKKKSHLKMKIDNVSDRIDKISKIKSGMADI